MTKPDQDKTLLSKDFADEVAKLVSQKNDGEIRPCAVCGHRHFNIESRIFSPWPVEVLEDQKLNLPFSFPTYPLGMMVCINCGNTHMINLKVLGLTQYSKYILEKYEG